MFDPPLRCKSDYTMIVKSPTTAELTLESGKKWRSDGAPGPLKIKRLDTGAGYVRVDFEFGSVTVAKVQANLDAYAVAVEPALDRKVYESSPPS